MKIDLAKNAGDSHPFFPGPLFATPAEQETGVFCRGAFRERSPQSVENRAPRYGAQRARDLLPTCERAREALRATRGGPRLAFGSRQPRARHVAQQMPLLPLGQSSGSCRVFGERSLHGDERRSRRGHSKRCMPPGSLFRFLSTYVIFPLHFHCRTLRFRQFSGDMCVENAKFGFNDKIGAEDQH
jgi:hypothetical protein